ncbi:MAG TPA: VLRF1 family aeRF1-type release factor [Bacillales bacterium]
MNLKTKLDELKKVEFEKPKKVFTMYLDTDRSKPDQQNGEWKIRLKNGLKQLQQYIENSGADDELKQFKTIKEKVQNEIRDNERDLLRGVILFATADGEIWFVEKLPISVETAFYWETSPAVSQLESLEKRYPYMGVLLIQKDRAAVLETEMGILEDKNHYTLDLETNDWREHQGPQGDDLTVGGQKKDQFQERVEANRQRWFKNLASKIEKKAGKRNWEQLYLVGEKDEIEDLKPYFNKKIDKTIPRNLLNRRPHEILNQVLE